jgi:beta-galactosidase
MPTVKNCFSALACAALVLGNSSLNSQDTPHNQTAPDLSFPTVLYGAAYYNEYMPGDQAARLDKDVALMKAAGLTVVRMGESTWSLWEPEDGQFDYAWMDRIVDAMGKAGIKVILGTPTYSIPAWMAHQHPEILADRLSGSPYGGPTTPGTYGMRQNMDTDSPAYRFYAERLIRHIVAHYKDNPNVIGWQLDNETSSYDAANTDVFIGFQHYLEKKFGTPEALSKAWFLNYWGQNLHTWEDLPRRDGAQSTGYKLEWSRWSQLRVTDFLRWQAGLVRECASPRQFVTTDYGGMMKRDVNEEAIATFLDIPADNIYHGTQDHYDGAFQSLQTDFTRSLKHSNFLVTETNAQTIGWSSEGQFPPTTANCARMSTPTSPTAPTWSNTGTGLRLPPIRKPTGRAFSRTTSSPTAPMLRSAAPPTNCRSSAHNWSASTSKTMSPFFGAATRPMPSASCPTAAPSPTTAGPTRPTAMPLSSSRCTTRSMS